MKADVEVAIGRVVRELPNLNVLIFWVWQDHLGQTTSIEANSKGHLCETLSKYGGGLGVINLRPHKMCEQLWNGLPFPRLHRLLVQMGAFLHCEESPVDEIAFHRAYKKARGENKLPSLLEEQCIISLS